MWISLRIWSTNEIVKSCFHISSDFEKKCWISKWIIWMKWGGIFSTVITVVKVACLHIFIFWQMFAKKKINKCPDNTDIFPCSRYFQIHICLDIVKWGREACRGPCWVIVFFAKPLPQLSLLLVWCHRFPISAIQDGCKKWHFVLSHVRLIWVRFWNCFLPVSHLRGKVALWCIWNY